MERGSIVLIEPVPGIERLESDLGSFRQIGRLVNDESAGLHSSLIARFGTEGSEADRLQALWPALAAREHGDDLQTLAAQSARNDVPCPWTTSSRVPDTRPGRPRFGSAAKRSTAESNVVAVRAAASGVSQAI
jgi:hypothetical protein